MATIHDAFISKGKEKGRACVYVNQTFETDGDFKASLVNLCLHYTLFKLLLFRIFAIIMHTVSSFELITEHTGVNTSFISPC